MTRRDVNSSEHDIYYRRYLDKLSEDTELKSGFKSGKKDVINFFRKIPQKKLEYRYQPEKWSIKEVLQHLIDTERIFMYRCFRIARRDISPLTGFDQNIYIKPSRADEKSIDQLLYEYEVNRNNSINILLSLSDEDLAFIGNSNGGAMSARAAAFTIIGHDIWHMEVIKEKYL
ncbi:DinB family protein [Pseudotenacibaculum sp. MALMAid0570]|uniref:DinB family protein n=1 Tax=Pseudotenacibaculum sp. MALMAid0570 TaxID=3143938 RepID=UPI0032DE48D4